MLALMRQKIRQHAVSDGHRAAQTAWIGIHGRSQGALKKRPRPDQDAAQPLACGAAVAKVSPAARNSEAGVHDEEDPVEEQRRLLNGRVPQAEDWLEAWTLTHSGSSVSFRRQERQANRRGDPATNLRRTRRKQLAVMAEVSRKRKRSLLASSTNICLVLVFY